MRNKRGVSEIVSYTLLIIIAIGISVMVFAYLKVFIPKFQLEECPPDISLIIQEQTCGFTNEELELTLSNKGLFTTDGAIIRLIPPGSTVKTLISPTASRWLFSPQLAPGESQSKKIGFSASGETAGTGYTLEVEPFITTDGERVFCENAVVSRDISCN